MGKIVSIILVMIMTIGVLFYVINMEIGPGLKEGGENLKQKIEESTR